jgi:transcriptional pleiotropic repressor
MSVLERIRHIRDILTQDGATIELETAAAKMGAVLESNVYLIANDGTVVGSFYEQGRVCTQKEPGESLAPQFHQRMTFLFQPAVNLPLEACLFAEGDCFSRGFLVSLFPLLYNGEKAGSLILARKREFSEEEMALLEVAALVAAVFMGRKEPSKIGKLANVRIALDSLSYSELVAIKGIFKELGGEEGFLVASKVADRIGITRSVIVNALRKLESAGVLESRSLGMKGTYIKVKNGNFLAELKRRGK